MKIEFPKKNPNLKKAKFHINPDYYWKLIFYTSLFVLLAGCAVGFYLFSKTNADFKLDENAQSSVETINKKELESSLQYFEEKKTKSENILLNPSPVTDPSI